MCGIAGVLRFDTITDKDQVIRNMTDAMVHRGPDDDGHWIDGPVALGHKRLSIIDLSDLGHQPMESHDGRYVMVYNGEMYNFPEIKAELPNYPFKSATDTEVILAAYIEWGVECLQKFNGFFAFAIWDKQKQELFLARDRIGIKPLYYSHNKNSLVFGSEIRSLIKSGLIDKKIDQEGLTDYLRYNTVHAPNTILQGVKMFLPGQYAVVNKEGMRTETYWDAAQNKSNAPKGKSYDEVLHDVRSLFTQSVEKRKMSDVPLGLFLSGGIDSSAVVATMAQVSQKPIKTYTITFEEEAFSEAKYARIIADLYQTEHHALQLKPADFLAHLPDALHSMDHPSGDGLNSYMVSKIIKDDGITVALSGTGGDELFGGYPTIFNRMQRLQQHQYLWSIPSFMRQLPGKILKAAKPSPMSSKIDLILKGADTSIFTVFPILRQLILDKEVANIMGKKESELAPNSVRKQIEVWNQQWQEMPFISRLSVGEIWFYLQNILLRDIDQMSMAHSLEVRVPFLDHELIEYVLAVKDDYKQLSSPKKLLTDAMGDLLPTEIVDRKKMGFTFPWAIWMKNEMKDFCEERVMAFSKRSFTDTHTTTKLWNDFLEGNSYITWDRVWLLVVLENWMEENGIDE